MKAFFIQTLLNLKTFVCKYLSSTAWKVIKELEISRNKAIKKEEDEAKPGKRFKIFPTLRTQILFLPLLQAELQNLRKFKQSKVPIFPA